MRVLSVRLFSFLVIAAVSFCFSSDIRLPELFSDDMVLQRDIAIPVWGWAAPGETVTVKLGTLSRDTVAAADSTWRVRFPAMKAGGPFEMIAMSSDSVIVKNILVGEVWLCSGQSNMEFTVNSTRNARTEMASARYPRIRMFTVEKNVTGKPAAGCRGSWVVCDSATVGNFSAAGYFFGRELHRKLGVPVGLIHSSWGGTPAESWTSYKTLNSDSMTRPIIVEYAKAVSDYPTLMKEYPAKLDAYDRDTTHPPMFHIDAGNAGFGLGWASRTCRDTAWGVMALPGALEAKGLNIDGAVWFRKTVVIPKAWVGKELEVAVGAVDDFDTTYVNGRVVGAIGENTPEYYAYSRQYPVPDSIVKTDTLIIAVRLFDHWGGGGMNGPANKMWIGLKSSVNGRIPLAGKWRYQVERVLDPKKATGPYARGIPRMPQSPNNSWRPAGLYNAMICPLAPYAMKGAIWYQGESNAGRGRQYQVLLPAMIRDWRTLWGQERFLFGIVQLANFMRSDTAPSQSDWAEIREAQTMTALADSGNGIALAIDIGDSGNIHPVNKQDVGRRLALWALAKAYGKRIEYSGPVFKEMSIDSGKAFITYTHADSGFTVKGKSLTGFAIAGPDSVFRWAKAAVKGKGVVVWSDSVRQPVAVRYAWGNNPAVNLYNKAGLPALPFRTDKWQDKVKKEER